LHGGLARQRLLELRRDGQRRGEPAAEQEHRHLQPGRHVSVHVPDPPLHARDRRRHVRGVLTLMLVLGAALAAAPRAHAATREYWVAAVDVDWNMIPNGHDAITGMMYDTAQTVFPTVVYKRYTKGWKKPLPNSKDQAGIAGPLLRARVGDRILVHFK